jgi:hypothetical protein
MTIGVVYSAALPKQYCLIKWTTWSWEITPDLVIMSANSAACSLVSLYIVGYYDSTF